MQPHAPKPFSSTPPPSIAATDVPVFHKEKHISYWLRCLRTPLPTAYTSNASNRLTLAFFSVSALDLLGVLFARTSPIERAEYIDWIYSCQHSPTGAFCGFPGGERYGEKASLPATYFALSSLCVLGDDLGRVRRMDCLRWLNNMQRKSGSFGETLQDDGTIHGGTDTRFGYCAMCIRWILRGDVAGPTGGIDDIDVENLVRCIRRSETYDGGISDEPFHEAHAGFTYCAIGALSLLNRLPLKRSQTLGRIDLDGKIISSDTKIMNGLVSSVRTTEWLLSRLTPSIEDDEFDDDDDDERVTPTSSQKLGAPPTVLGMPTSSEEYEPSFTKFNSSLASELHSNPRRSSKNPNDIPSSILPICWLGFNGRCNKIADTCYAWWVGASLKTLGALHFVDIPHLKAYLLEKSQHLIAGGFGKLPGDPPDIYHAYLGLAALALIDGHKDEDATIGPGVEDAKKQPDLLDDLGKKTLVDATNRRESESDIRVLRAIDPTLCFSFGVRRWIESLSWRQQLQSESSFS